MHTRRQFLAGIEALIKRLPEADSLREHLIAAHTLPEDAAKLPIARESKVWCFLILFPAMMLRLLTNNGRKARASISKAELSLAKT